MSEQATTVVAVFSTKGEITPRRFEWHGSSLTVEGVGRSWIEAGEYCFNVMALGGRLFELRLDRETLRWSIVRGPIPTLAA